LVSSGGSLSTVQAVDSTFQYSYGGNGRFLQGFGSGAEPFNGSDLGGGGGGQNCVNYGGPCQGAPGGRYGYAGGNVSGAPDSGENGLGPVGGRYVSGGSQPKGGGGSFGGGVGDSGNDVTYMTSGAGAVLIRWDTTGGFGVGFQTGRNGFP
jgi:hypothetical protein